MGQVIKAGFNDKRFWEKQFALKTILENTPQAYWKHIIVAMQDAGWIMSDTSIDALMRTYKIIIANDDNGCTNKTINKAFGYR